MKRRICKIIGHKWSESALECGVQHCERCDYTDAWGIKTTGEWTLRDEIEHRVWRAKHRMRFWGQRIKWLLSRKKDDQTPF